MKEQTAPREVAAGQILGDVVHVSVRRLETSRSMSHQQTPRRCRTRALVWISRLSAEKLGEKNRQPFGLVAPSKERARIVL